MEKIVNENLNQRTTRNGWHFSLFTRLRESTIVAYEQEMMCIQSYGC
jgi:hypothetical protein